MEVMGEVEEDCGLLIVDFLRLSCGDFSFRFGLLGGFIGVKGGEILYLGGTADRIGFSTGFFVFATDCFTCKLLLIESLVLRLVLPSSKTLEYDILSTLTSSHNCLKSSMKSADANVDSSPL